MTENKKKQAEKTQQEECIKDLRWLIYSVITNFPVGFIPVVQRKERLNYTRDPEKCQEPADKHKHFPLSDIGSAEVGNLVLRKNNADNEENNRLHQLGKLQPWYIVY